MSEVVGNPLSALIPQVVAYHNLTLIQSGVSNDDCEKTLLRGNFRYNRHRQRDRKALSEKTSRTGVDCYRPKILNSISTARCKSRQIVDVKRVGTGLSWPSSGKTSA